MFIGCIILVENYYTAKRHMSFNRLLLGIDLMLTFYLIISLNFNLFQNSELSGTYVSTKNGFEWHSTLILSEQYRFKYSYGISGCQGEITGNWRVRKGDLLEFTYDEEFRNDYNEPLSEEELSDFDSLRAITGYDLTKIKPCYPDLNSGTWIVKKRGLMLMNEMECSCWPVKGLHRKIK